MQIIRRNVDLKNVVDGLKKSGATIGFVPTMGALHIGHLSLIKRAKLENAVVICSIFVNPNQFNDKTDLENYPRTEKEDCELLKENNCDFVFMPSVLEVYPEKDERQFNFGDLDKILEGKSRPGHFNGVAQVVSRLFELVNPDSAFFGLKDYQQVLVVKSMVKALNLKVKIVPCDILREPDGLAFSSRNRLLSQEQRKLASAVPQFLQKAKGLVKQYDPQALKEIIQNEIENHPDIKLDYFEICDKHNLSNASSWNNPESILFLIAVYIGKVRLIDNISLV